MTWKAIWIVSSLYMDTFSKYLCFPHSFNISFHKPQYAQIFVEFEKIVN